MSPQRLALALVVSAIGALAAVVLWPPTMTHESMLMPRQLLEKPGKQGAGGHGLGGEICWEEADDAVGGFKTWTCAPSVATLGSARRRRHVASTKRAQPIRLYAFGTSAPAAGGWGGRPGYAFNSDGLPAYDALPPRDWGDNYDGNNFVDPFHGPGGLVAGDRDYWEAATAPPLTPLPFAVDEDVNPSPADESWNSNVWCPAGVCDFTSDSAPGAFDIDHFGAPAGGYVPY